MSDRQDNAGGHGRDRRGQGLREMQGFSRIPDPGYSERAGKREKHRSAINRELRRNSKSITVNIYYSGINGAARKFAEEMVTSCTVAAIRDTPFSLAPKCNGKGAASHGLL